MDSSSFGRGDGLLSLNCLIELCRPLNPTSDHYVRSDPSRQAISVFNLQTPLVPVADPLRSLFLVRRCPEIANSNYTLRTPKTPIDCSALAI
ncbi:hypothetical protein PGT21_005603 [Puccinia graminis f. sp. tritici]|uniref:Uncharacterized protein n=1 Tax=Puccinia graminis f. sp. tritici TaxID=56615 RepID=A0A5B0M583_PUCGR|nr:hypothetical protein PGT21_005603 [Puccinia graminis f. sp. tritici]KAA1123148.1 hypothetical protein PGTUg99_016043 [Puccinia graminis f. sp. tritici]